MKPQYDIVINGAGIPGLTLALLLTRNALQQKPSILLLDRQQPEVPDEATLKKPASVDDYDLRVFALTAASKQILEMAGAWPGDDSNRVHPYQQMQVWDSGSAKVAAGEIYFDAAEIGAPALGTIVEGRVVQHRLMQAVQQHANIELLFDDEMTALTEAPDGMEITLGSGGSTHARLLVGADGAGSQVKKLVGIDSVGWPYYQRALVATVETERDHQQTAWQRFMPDGPLAFLPLQKPFCSIVWTLPQDRAIQYCDMPDDEFMRVLEKDFQSTLGEIKAVSSRASFPLRLSHARSYIAPRTALVADAAHTVHPLAGQGLNLGLLDVAALAQQLVTAMQAQKDFSARRVLRAYERSRKGDNWLMQGSFDVLTRLFSNEQVLLAGLRNGGLNAINQIALVKNLFARKALGRAYKPGTGFLCP